MPSAQSLRVQEIEIHHVKIDISQPSYPYIQFYEKGVLKPYSLPGNIEQLDVIYSDLTKNLSFPTHLTLYVASPILGLGKLQEVLGVESEEKFYLDPVSNIAAQRKKSLWSFLVLLCMGVFFTLAIHCDWEWVWNGEG